MHPNYLPLKMSATSRGVERCRLLWEGNPWVTRIFTITWFSWSLCGKLRWRDEEIKLESAMDTLQGTNISQLCKGKSSTQYCFSGRDMLVPRKVERRDLYLFAPTRSFASGIPTKPWLRSSLCVFSLVQRNSPTKTASWCRMNWKYLLHSPKKVLYCL